MNKEQEQKYKEMLQEHSAMAMAGMAGQATSGSVCGGNSIDTSITGTVRAIQRESQRNLRRSALAGELDNLLTAHPEVARILDLKKELGL